MKQREAEEEEGGTKEGRRFKFQIRYRISEAAAAAGRREGGGRGSATFFAAALPNGLGGRAGGDRVKTIQSQRGIGSDKERRGGTEGDKQINLQSEWGGLPRLPSSLLLYLALPPSRDCARSGGAACQKLFSAMALRSSPVAAKRGSGGRNPRSLPPSYSLLPSFEVRNLSLRKC